MPNNLSMQFSELPTKTCNVIFGKLTPEKNVTEMYKKNMYVIFSGWSLECMLFIFCHFPTYDGRTLQQNAIFQLWPKKTLYQ